MIERQIREARETIAREVAEFEARYPPEEEERKPEDRSPEREGGKQAPHPDKESKEAQDASSHAPDTVGPDTNHAKSTEIPKTDTATPTNDNTASAHNHQDAHRGHEDDSGEVVEEDKEDTVIY